MPRSWSLLGWKGVPKSYEEPLEIGLKLLLRLLKDNVDINSIFLDPVICPLSTDSKSGLVVSDAIKGLKNSVQGVHFISGVSNVSYGLPARRVVNRAFLVMLMVMGLDAAIIDPLDRSLMGILWASDALLGQDDYCLEFIKFSKSGKINKD